MNLRSILTGAAFAVLASAASASGAEDSHAEGGTPVWIWEVLNFSILVAVLVYFGRKPISDMFTSRRADIVSDIDKASELLAQAEVRNSEWQRRLADLDGELARIRSGARHRAEEEAERILAEAADGAERIRRDAVAAVEHELRRAQTALREEAASLATELAAGILSSEVRDGDRDRLMDEFISRVGANGAGRNA